VTDQLAATADRAGRQASWLNPLKVLLRADVTVQLRSYRSLFLSFALPLIVLLVTSTGGKRTAKLGGPYVVVQLALTVGLVSIGAIGYAMSVARDRDQGVLQRLRVTPAPTWTIMGSRWVVQIAAVLVMSVVVLIAAAVIDSVTLSAAGYVMTIIVALLGSAVFLSIGQAIVGLIPSADTLNAAGRLLYLPLVGLSLFGRSDVLGAGFELVSRWSPGGCLETLLSAAMGASPWTGETWGALLVSAAYTAVFAGIGIRWFRWIGR
jgi:ABC-2 type transport system permease protein